jgi:membrane protein YdbS with pleckstrin-like domain
VFRRILIALNLALAFLCAGWFYAFPTSPAWWLDPVCTLALFLFAGVAWGLYRRSKFTFLLALFAIVAGTLLFFGTEDTGFPHGTHGPSFAVAFLVYFGAIWAVGILSMYRGLRYFNKRRARSRHCTRSDHSR